MVYALNGIIITSNNPRHRYFAKILSKKFNIKLILSEDKGQYYSNQKKESQIVREHFYNLEIEEKKVFGNIDWPEIDTKLIPKNFINSEKIIKQVIDLNPEFIFLFGSSILSETWINKFDKKIINLHLGLSPYYKGSATLFWPIANNEIECVGATIHLAEKAVDSGKIIARIKPTLQIGDNLYTLSYKTIRESIDKFPEYCLKFKKGIIKPFIPNCIDSKIYKKADFNDEYLLKALNNIKGGLTKQQINQIKISNKCGC